MVKKAYVVFASLLLSLFIFSCGPRISNNYQNPTSSIIPLLIDQEDLDDTWKVEKIFSSQVINAPQENDMHEEISVRVIWSYNKKLKGDVFLEHDVYRYKSGVPDNPKDLPFTISGTFTFIGKDLDGISTHKSCDKSERNQRSNCLFVLIPEDGNIAMLLIVIVPSESDIRDIDIVYEALLTSIKRKMISWIQIE